jgi:hypothetical protein
MGYQSSISRGGEEVHQTQERKAMQVDLQTSLKPCPFCKKDGWVKFVPDEGAVICFFCGTHGPTHCGLKMEDAMDPIALWNNWPGEAVPNPAACQCNQTQPSAPFMKEDIERLALERHQAYENMKAAGCMIASADNVPVFGRARRAFEEANWKFNKAIERLKP